MLKRITVILMLVIVGAVSTSHAASNPQWEYLVTRGGSAYSVDINSVQSQAGDLLTFTLAVDNKNTIDVACTVVNTKTLEFRMDEGYTYDKQQKKVINTFGRPTKWMKIGQGSAIDLATDALIRVYAKPVEINS